MLRAPVLVLACLLSALPARAEAPAKAKGVRSMVVLDFTSPPDFADKARSLTSLVTAELAKRPSLKLVTSGDVQKALGLERQKALMGCTETSCMAEIGGALGARYVLSGQVEKFGSKYVLTGSVFDAESALSLGKSAQTATREEDLPAAALALADDLGQAVGPASAPAATATATAAPNAPAAAPASPTAALEIKLGDALPTFFGADRPKLSSFNLKLGLTLDYFATPSILPFLDASLVLARAEGNESVQFVPLLLGCKYLFRPGHDLRPYAGAGLGLGFLLGRLLQKDASQTGFSLYGVGGLAYFPWSRVGFNGEASVSLANIQLSAAQGLLASFNLNFGLVVLL